MIMVNSVFYGLNRPDETLIYIHQRAKRTSTCYYRSSDIVVMPYSMYDLLDSLFIDCCRDDIVNS